MSASLDRCPRVFDEIEPLRESYFDEYGHVYTIWYLHLVFESRWNATEKLGFSKRESLERGVAFPVVHTEVSYIKEIRHTEKSVRVRSWVKSIAGSKFTVLFELSHPETPTLIYATGQVVLLLLGFDGQRVTGRIAPPDWLLDLVFEP